MHVADQFVSRELTQLMMEPLLTYSIDLENIFDSQFIGTVQFGKPNQKVDVLFDTGSPWTWVYSLEGCKSQGNNCPDVIKYSLQASTSQNYAPTVILEDIQLNYTLGTVIGDLITDQFCLTGVTSCLRSPLTFLAVEEAEDMESYEASGFIGLAPKTPPSDHSDIFPSFMQQI